MNKAIVTSYRLNRYCRNCNKLSTSFPPKRAGRHYIIVCLGANGSLPCPKEDC